VKHGDHFDTVLSPNQTSMIFMGLIITIILAQITLHWWKRTRYRSFMTVTLIGLWVIPTAMSLWMHWWRFVLFWSVWTSYTLYMVSLSSKAPLAKSTPRRVYAWFFGVYRLSYASAIFGYVCIVLSVFGVTFIFHIQHTTAAVGSTCLFYGLYFGVLGRDVAELCAEWMANAVGITKAQQKYYDPCRCAICNIDFKDPESDEMAAERTFELSCKHVFHEQCIRGWALVGKKDTCPLCCEKVNMKVFSKGPWDGKGQVWAQLLDAVRYLIVWNPIIMILLNVSMHTLGLH